jgi:regulator of sigma E protease
MSFVYAFLGFAALIILHELGHFAAAKAVGMRVERFALFFPPLIASVRRGETEYAIGSVPFGGYVKITGMSPAEEIPADVAHRAYFRQPVWKRVVVIAAGPLVNVLVAFLLLLVFFVAQGPAVGVNTTVDRVTPKSAAVGVLRPGDRLLAVDGVRGDAERLRKQIGTHTCAGTPTQGCGAATPAVLTVQRDGRGQTLRIRPRYDAKEKRSVVGFAFSFKYQPQGLAEATGSSVRGMWRVTTQTVSTVGRLFYSSQARKEVSGIVGTYEVTRQTIQKSTFENAISILALISLSLAIINLFPFLPLDGGHIFWAVAEKLRGRAIALRTMERASLVGFALVLCLFAIGLTNDIGRLGGDGFGVQR